MADHIVWAKADQELEEVISLLPLGNYGDYAEYLRVRGFPTATAGAVRRRCQRKGLDEQVARIRFSAQLEHDNNIRPDLQLKLDNKKETNLSWRDMLHHAQEGKRIREQASPSQRTAKIVFPTAERSLSVIILADWHVFNLGTDHEAVERVTDQIMSHRDLYICILGDMSEIAIRMRGVKEMQNQHFGSSMQAKFLRSWLAYIEPRVLFSTWDNHFADREDELTALDTYEQIFSRKMIYFDGIGHLDLTLNDQTYKVAASHKFRTRSRNNPCQGQMNYMRYEAQDREIALAGDSHIAGLLQYREGGIWRLAANTGTFNVDHDWARRNFSLSAAMDMPVMQLFADRHLFQGYQNIDVWDAVKNGR